MSIGLVNFFEYTQLGFYRVGDEYSEDLEMDTMLASLYDWYQDRISLEDTLLWDDKTPGFSRRKKIYLKSIEKNEDTGDYILILWRTVGKGDGVYGIKANARLDDDTLYNADDIAKGTKVIWGEAAYYWFIPSLNVFASIRFPNSIADTEMLNLYFRDFINLHSNIRIKKREIKEGTYGTYTSVSFSPLKVGESGNLWFRINSKQYAKHTTKADLGAIAKEITHFVKRDVIAAQVSQTNDWTKFFKGLPFVSAEKTRDTRRIEINIEAKPTVDELKKLFDLYEKEYDSKIDKWRNLGFKKEGSGSIVWLSNIIIRSELPIDDTSKGGEDESGHYTVNRIFTALKFRRDGLLMPISPEKTVKKSIV